MISTFFFFNDTATTEIYTLSLHDALPICAAAGARWRVKAARPVLRAGKLHPGPRALDRSRGGSGGRSRDRKKHTSELQSPCNIVCRLLLEKKKKIIVAVSSSCTDI